MNPPNFLILDEPTTHLDLQGRRTLEEALQRFGGTICLVSHDTEFVRNVADHVIAITPAGLKEYPGGYDYYIEKSGETGTGTARAPDPVRAESKKQESPEQPRKSARDLRKERARERQARHAETKQLKKQIVSDEKQIAVLEKARQELLEEIGGAEAGFDFESANRRLKTIQDDINQRTRRWEVNSEILEEADGRA